jgi:hypothetical protein
VGNPDAVHNDMAQKVRHASRRRRRLEARQVDSRPEMVGATKSEQIGPETSTIPSSGPVDRRHHHAERS